MAVRASRQWYALFPSLASRYLLLTDPDANQPRRGAAAAWNAFSGHVTQTIPFSLIRRDAREKATLNGQPAARCFSIHDVQQSEELDGAARQNGRCFQLGKC